MNGFEYIKSKQRRWANLKGFNLIGGTIPNKGEKNYLEEIKKNLFHAELAGEILSQYERGDGNETKDSKTRLAKMKALHSSSALVANTFQYWHNKDVLPILHACKLCLKSRKFSTNKIGFEKKFVINDDTEMFPFPSNVDIVVNDSQQIYAIESKFTEPYRGKPKGIKKKYIDNVSFWDGLESLYGLAKKICPVCPDEEFRYLDAAQLIKHILGLKKHGKNFRLLYLWYDVIGQEGAEHRKEIERFAKVAKKDIQFSHITYQEVIMSMHRNFYYGNEEYCNYMTDRYL